MPLDALDALARLPCRLANLRVDGGFHLGAEQGDRLLDVTATGAALGLPAPRDVDDLLQNNLAVQVEAILARVAGDGDAGLVLATDAAAFAPLVTRPEKIVCVGFNYREHAAETGVAEPKEPPLFSKFANALNAHRGTIALPTKVDDRFDFETELVLVIGRACRDVSEAEALDVLAGYTIGNDVSARTRQMATSQFGAGKWSDGFAPIGPWLVPRGLVPDPHALRLRTTVNGAVRQDWTTSDMIFGCRKLIAYCSAIMTLRPGDVIFTGTPQGVILGEKAPPEQRRWLRAGDRVVSSIEGLGELAFGLG